MLALPAGCLRAGTWFVPGLELAFAPLALAPRLRPRAWGLMVGVQLGLLALLDFADLTLGMARPPSRHVRPGMAASTGRYDDRIDRYHLANNAYFAA